VRQKLAKKATIVYTQNFRVTACCFGCLAAVSRILGAKIVENWRKMPNVSIYSVKRVKSGIKSLVWPEN
jgi:hypothetical protein